MLLKPNIRWNPMGEKKLPHVVANVIKESHYLHVRFQVTEPEYRFAAFVDRDGGHSWEDSCVEIFVNSLDSNDYINFEFTSRGFCYAARGLNRAHRKEFLKMQYTHILRTVKAPIFANGLVHWEIQISLPAFLLGTDSLDGKEIYGNLYKCGDRTRSPHYLTLFPIATDKPDFHQPRFFKKLLISNY